MIRFKHMTMALVAVLAATVLAAPPVKRGPIIGGSTKTATAPRVKSAPVKTARKGPPPQTGKPAPRGAGRSFYTHRIISFFMRLMIRFSSREI